MNTTEKTITVDELSQLNGELNGLFSSETKEVVLIGFLKLLMPLKIKYLFNKVAEQVEKETKAIDTLLKEAIENAKVGIVEPELKEGEEPSEERLQWVKEINAKLEPFNKEISAMEVTLNMPSDLSFESLERIEGADYYPIIFKLL